MKIPETDGLIILKFTATWCGPCKKIAPEIDILSKTYPDILFISIDVDQDKDLTEEYKIMSMPTFVAIRDGKEMGRCTGANIKAVKNLLIH